MTTENFKRKLTAILSADVVGYSRLMGEDEAATVKTLETYKGVMFSLIKQHRGRVVDSPGDNLLAEFGSVVDAVQCAVSIQKELQTRNADLPENRKMEFRIGINLGDVIEEQDRIYGDGVNIAARLEALADPGGICVSKTAFDHIESKLPLGYEFLGEQTVKNIAKPVGAYRVLMEPRVTSVKVVEEKKAIPFWRRKSVFSIGLMVILGIAAFLYWNFNIGKTSVKPASVDKMAYPLPDKPSIAVLPFTNMSGDPEQDYIGDGLSENIISALSVSSQIFVIARNTTFTYKGKAVDIKKVAEDLGVQYVLEGSIQKSGDQLRVTAQFIDALTGHHLWSEVYDREMKNLFELQDEITKKIMVSLQVELSSLGVDARVFSKSTDNLEAWKHFIKGKELLENFIEQDNAKAREHFEIALKLDPEYVPAMSQLSSTYSLDVQLGWSDSPSASINRAFELAQKAVELDDQDSNGHMGLGYILVLKGMHEKAIIEGTRAITLNPNFALGYGMLGAVMTWSGQFDDAVTMIKKAYRLNPNLDTAVLIYLVTDYIFLGRYEEALEVCNEMEQQVVAGRMRGLSFFSPLFSSWVYQELGREEEARAYMAEALKRGPGLSLEWYKNANPYKNPANLQQALDAFRKAGMPERAPGAVQEKPSIAVLPFENLSSDKEQEYFSDGLSEELINKLSQVKDLQVTARTSSFYFKGRNEDMRIIGEKLGVTYLLEGSVRKSGNQLRINAQLIKAEDGYHLFSKTYDRELKDIFAIQDEIAKAVTTALSITLGVGKFNRPGMTRNMEAYDVYLHAKANLYKFTPDSVLTAIDQLNHALDIDPDFGLGWRLLYQVYKQGISLLPPGQSVDFEARRSDALERARAIAPDMPEILMSTADDHVEKGNWLEADRILKKILDDQGHVNSEANGRYGRMLLNAGRSNDALTYLQRAKRLDPLEPRVSLYLSTAQSHSKGIDEALVEARHGQTLEGFDRIFFYLEFRIALEVNDRPRAAAVITGYYNLEGGYL